MKTKKAKTEKPRCYVRRRDFVWIFGGVVNGMGKEGILWALSPQEQLRIAEKVFYDFPYLDIEKFPVNILGSPAYYLKMFYLCVDAEIENPDDITFDIENAPDEVLNKCWEAMNQFDCLTLEEQMADIKNEIDKRWPIDDYFVARPYTCPDDLF